MLGQAAAVLVSFPARLAAEFDPVDLPALPDEGLSIAGPANAGLLHILSIGHVVEIVVNCAVVQLHVSGHKLVGVGWQARGRRRHAAGHVGTRGTRLGHGVSTTTNNWHSSGPLAGLGQYCGYGSGIGVAARHALSAGDAVIGIERGGQD